MRGLMQDRPLLISTLIKHADLNHADTEIVSRAIDGSITRSTYQATAARIRQLARALTRLGLATGDRIGTLAWNNHRHFELYYAVSGCGFVCHTINPRLFVEQIVYIVNHAGDRIVCFDLGFLDLVRRIAPLCPGVEGWIALGAASAIASATDLPRLDASEDLISRETPDFEWPQFDEHTAAALCYTSGTTGDPKGVLYSHRSSVLHALSISLPDALCLSARDVLMPAASMFHVNAWGSPYAAALTGATLVLPGPLLDPENLHDLIEREAVTHSVGVPTIWLGLLQYLERSGNSLSTLKRVVVGGSACPPALMAAYRDRYGVEIVHAWGMSETSPIVTVNQPKRKHAGLTGPERDFADAAQGRIAAGVEMKVVGSDGHEIARDGMTPGDLMVRGWWVARAYFNHEEQILDAGGWFHTGDVATIDADGYMRITDRSKDVIKSGGEWISSIALENLAVGHPSVAEAAVIGVKHPKWDERPLLIVRLKEGHQITGAEMMAFLNGKVARWWLPDDMVVVDHIPHTATGKILKRRLREDFKNHVLPSV